MSQTYVLRSLLPAGVRRALVDDPAADAAQGFKMVVLALIELSGGALPLEDLWRHLGHGLGASESDREHPAFGRAPEELLRELERTRHVIRSQRSGANGAEVVLEAGEHAAAEFGPGGVRAFVEAEFADAPGFETAAAAMAAAAAAAAAGDDADGGGGRAGPSGAGGGGGGAGPSGGGAGASGRGGGGGAGRSGGGGNGGRGGGGGADEDDGFIDLTADE